MIWKVLISWLVLSFPCQGVWKDLFKPNSAITEPALLFRRPVFRMNRAVEEPSLE